MLRLPVAFPAYLNEKIEGSAADPGGRYGREMTRSLFIDIGNAMGGHGLTYADRGRVGLVPSGSPG